jgi:hypothetical protein
MITTALVSFYYYVKVKDTGLKYLPFFLLFVVFYEMVAFVLFYKKNSNIWLYNIGVNVEILFYISVFYSYLERKIHKKIALYGGVFYELFFLIHYSLSSNYLIDYQSYPFLLGALLLVVLIMLFIIQFIQSDKILFLQKYLIFWISIGLLFYYVVPIPLDITRQFMNSELTKGAGQYLRNIQYVSNVIMYLTFIYGFIWSSMKYK